MKKLAVAVLLAGSLVAVLAAPGAGAAPSGTLTLTGKPSPRDQKTIDTAPRGESVGDRLILSETLRSVPRIGGRGDDFAILGGSGAYAGASGTAQVESTSKGDRITLRFSS